MTVNGRQHYTQADLIAVLDAAAALDAAGHDSKLIPVETLLYFVGHGYTTEDIVGIVNNQPVPMRPSEVGRYLPQSRTVA